MIPPVETSSWLFAHLSPRLERRPAGTEGYAYAAATPGGAALLEQVAPDPPHTAEKFRGNPGANLVVPLPPAGLVKRKSGQTTEGPVSFATKPGRRTRHCSRHLFSCPRRDRLVE